MRLLAILLALIIQAPDSKGTIDDEQYNFKISMPEDSVDWEMKEIPKDRAMMRAYFYTEFRDSDPTASADFQIFVQRLTKDLTRRSLDKIAGMWSDSIESIIEFNKKREEAPAKLGTVDAWKIDVTGNDIHGKLHLTWMLVRNGEYLYTFFIMRRYDAVDDEDLEDEIKAILTSFTFHEIVKIKASKKGGSDDAPDVPAGGGKKSGGKKIDKMLLKKEKFKEPFWRFEMTKPEGLLKLELSDADKKNGIKYYFRGDKDGSRLMIRVYAQTEKAKKFTLEKLLEHKMGYWEKEVKQKKEPKLDKNYRKFPMLKKAIRLDLIGRSTVNIRRTWIMADCKNDRQYQLEIYVTGANGQTVWGKRVEQFLKGFKPIKR